MNKFSYYFITVLILVTVKFGVFGQAETQIKFCSSNLTNDYVSDGQQYISLLNGDEIAEFRATFYGGSTYRVAACSGLTNGNLIFSVYDRDRNELFSNRNYKNSPYWDFKFTSTTECIIEAQLDPKGPESGFAILLIGFKQ
ncbi:MAG: hypothetical protein DRI95_00875 [Bacteroidetes bacterium]|nr:MAG: hypothetical protein DRI95_00875 [Bacteroidota bacterium]RLD84987.1 MAG: hypothetical protein DRJ07_04035 [Bacteroidota bacterium]